MGCNQSLLFGGLFRRELMEENTRKLTFVVVFLSLFVFVLFSLASIV